MAFIAAIIVAIIFFHSNAEPFYNRIPLTAHGSTGNYIVNMTPYAYMDTVIFLGLDKLNVTGVSVLIKELSSDTKKSFADANSLDLNAAIIGNRKQFIIYVKPMGRYECIPVISHELVHLSQYHRGRMRVLTTNQVVWDGATMNVIDMEYNDRPWEKEAFADQDRISTAIKQKLY